MFLPDSCFFNFHFNLPRTRGGVSELRYASDRVAGSSPHPRGCFLEVASVQNPDWIFPAPAGVFPGADDTDLLDINLPRTRGGVSFY